MSKRYGRNQKRQHRERIALLESQLSRAQADLRNWHRLDDALSDARRVLGDSVYLPSREVYGDAGDLRRVSMRGIRPSWTGDFDTELNIEYLYALIAQVDRDHAQRAMHLSVRSRDGAATYALSEVAIAVLSESQLARLIEREIAPRLAELAARQLKTRALEAAPHD